MTDEEYEPEFVHVDEDPSSTEEQLLDWLCWCWAMEGERFYPPDETAEECIKHFEEVEVESEVINVTEDSQGWEYGEHTRAWSTAIQRFMDLKDRGFDPKARAQREIARSRAEGLALRDIDWSWWEDE